MRAMIITSNGGASRIPAVGHLFLFGGKTRKIALESLDFCTRCDLAISRNYCGRLSCNSGERQIGYRKIIEGNFGVNNSK